MLWVAGRDSAHDVAAFARDSISTNVQALEPSNFPDRVLYKTRVWFVDFFAPVSTLIALIIRLDDILQVSRIYAVSLKSACIVSDYFLVDL